MRAADDGFRYECMWCRTTTRDFFTASGSHAKKACAPHRAEANRSTGTEPISPVEQPGQGVSADDEQVSSGDVGPQTS